MAGLGPGPGTGPGIPAPSIIDGAGDGTGPRGGTNKDHFQKVPLQNVLFNIEYFHNKRPSNAKT